jgi:hypothetical protein
MTAADLTSGVTQRTVLVGLVAALGAGALAGLPGALGVLAGGALALVSFRVLAARVRALAGPDGVRTPWLVLAGLRFVVVSGVAVVLFVGGWAHPVAWLVGYSILPFAVVMQGLRLAREESRA